MKTFERSNLKSKQNYYRIFIVLEVLAAISLFYFNVNGFVIFFAFPILLIDMYSNKRCLNRQKNFIQSVEFKENNIVCTHLKNNQTVIPFKKVKFSIREEKFEKDQTEIEIKFKKAFKSRLIGRLHIDNWDTIFELQNELLNNNITQVKYRPEGFWSKYGILTADIVITGTAMAGGALAEMNNDFNTASSLNNVFMPLSDIKDSIELNKEKERQESYKK